MLTWIRSRMIDAGDKAVKTNDKIEIIR